MFCKGTPGISSAYCNSVGVPVRVYLIWPFRSYFSIRSLRTAHVRVFAGHLPFRVIEKRRTSFAVTWGVKGNRAIPTTGLIFFEMAFVVLLAIWRVLWIPGDLFGLAVVEDRV